MASFTARIESAETTSSSERPATILLLSLPTDIVFRCIPLYLSKEDQYELFSTCKACNPWLVEARTIYIAGSIPDMSDTMADKQLSSNVYLVSRFLKGNREALLRSVGCIVGITGNETSANSRLHRKLRLTIGIDDLKRHIEVVLSVAEYVYELKVTVSISGSDQGFNVPMHFDNPTAKAISRWLKSCWLERSDSGKTWLPFIHEYVTKVEAELGEQEVSQHAVGSWNELRGVSKVIIKDDNRCYVELGADADVSLQSVTYDHCATVAETPAVPNITLLHCPKLHDVWLASGAIHVHLEGMNIVDLRVLGGVKQLVVKDCKVVTFPTPAIGKGQEWEFINADIVDVSGLQSLEKLTLIDCKYVKDGSMLGNVQTLAIEGGSMEHYPVPKTGRGQAWTLRKVDMADVSGLAMLESLTLIECQQVTDISMLGAVRYLTIEGCGKLLSTEQYPKAVGMLQEWSLKSMDVQGVCLSNYADLHQLTLAECNVASIDELLCDTRFRNMQALDLKTASIAKINISVSNGKAKLVDKSTLSTAAKLWCEHEDIAKRIYGDIETWDVSKVKDMSEVFSSRPAFNNNINAWDVSNVMCMVDLFKGAASFNQPLDSWKVTNVTKMYNMFFGATVFNQPLDSWDMRNVAYLSYMFYRAPSFNQPLDKWDVSGATNMRCMFCAAKSFNQPIDSWDVSNVTDMWGVFSEASLFNQPLNSWNVSKVTNMSHLFEMASTFNQPLDTWDVSKVTDMSIMFYKALSFNQPLESWNVSNVKITNWMFREAPCFNQPLSSWDMSNVKNMNWMFGEATSFNQPLNTWNVSKVTNMNCMFVEVVSFNQPLDSWNVSKVTAMFNMFNGAESFNQPLNTWDVSNVMNMGYMFNDAKSFNQPLDLWDVGKVTNMTDMFCGAASFNQALGSWNVSNVTDMDNMFRGATCFNQPLDSWEVKEAVRKVKMFVGASSLNPLPSWYL